MHILDSLPAKALQTNLKTAFMIAAESGVEGAEEYLQEVIKQVAAGGSLFTPTPREAAERILAGEAGKHLGLIFGAASGINYVSRGAPGSKPVPQAPQLPNAPTGPIFEGGGEHGPESAGVVGEYGQEPGESVASSPVPVPETGGGAGQVGQKPGEMGPGDVQETTGGGGPTGPGIGAGYGSDHASGATGSGRDGSGAGGTGSATDRDGEGVGEGPGRTPEGSSPVPEERRNTLNPGLRNRVYPYAYEHHRDEVEGPWSRGVVDHKFQWIGNSFAEQVSEEANPDWHSVAFDVRGFKDINTQYGYEVADAVLDKIAQKAQRAAQSVEPEATIFRYGGDEFIIHVPKNGNEVAKTIEDAFGGDGAIVEVETPSGNTVTIKTKGVRTAVSTIVGGRGERRSDALRALEERSKREGSAREGYGGGIPPTGRGSGEEGRHGRSPDSSPEGVAAPPQGDEDSSKVPGRRGGGGAPEEVVIPEGEVVEVTKSTRRSEEGQPPAGDRAGEGEGKAEERGGIKTPVVTEPPTSPSPTESETKPEKKPIAEDITGVSEAEVPAAEAAGDLLEDEYEFPEEEISKVRSGSAKAPLKENAEAVLIAKRLAEEKRAATEEERKKLAAFRGWGILERVFLPEDQLDEETKEIRKKIIEAIGEEGFKRAGETTLNSHYTDPAIAHAIWEALKSAGFDGGSVLEPAVGSGVFIGTLDKETRSKSSFTAVDMDPAATSVVRALYPRSVRKLFTKRLQDTHIPDNAYDVAVTNVPFANVSINYVRNGKFVRKLKLHDYFIVRMLDALKPGGVAVVVTSRFTLDKLSSEARRMMYERADLLGAVRLPSATFSGYSGTQVVTDILVFRKRKPEEQPGDSTWLETVPVIFYDPYSLAIRAEDRINKFLATKLDPETGARVPVDQPPVGEKLGYRISKATQVALEKLKKMQDEGALMLPVYSGSNRSLVNIPSVFGDLAIDRGLYSDKELVVDLLREGVSNEKEALDTLKSAVQSRLTEILSGKYDPEEPAEADEGEKIPEWLADGSVNPALLLDDLYIAEDGSIYRVEYGADGMPKRLVKDKVANENKATVIAAHKTYQALMRVLEADSTPGEAAVNRAKKERANLKKAYEELKKEFGEKKPLSSPDLTAILGNGPARWALTSLEVERKDDQGKVISFEPSQIFEKPVITRARQFRITSISDVATISMATKAKYDPEFMARLAIEELPEFKGKSQEQAEEEIRNFLLEQKMAFIDPESGDLVSDIHYLSGNVRKKLRVARRAAKRDKRFEVNVAALENALPPKISLRNNPDVSISIGSPIFHPAIAERMILGILYLLGDNTRIANSFLGDASALAKQYLSGELSEDDDSLVRTVGVISISHSGRYQVMLERLTDLTLAKKLTGYVDVQDAYNVLNRAVEAALNGVDPAPKPEKINDTYVITEHEQERVAMAKSLADSINNALRSAIIDGGDAYATLVDYAEERFNEMFNGWRSIQPSLEHFRDPETGELSIVGINKTVVKPRQYQVKAIWKTLLSGMRGMIAHEVGLGKTLTLAGIAIEAKRLGIVNKPVIAVPKSQIVQFTDAVRQYFPNAKILSSSFVTNAATRRQFYGMLLSTDPDVVIMTHEHLTYMQPSEDVIRQIYEAELEELREELTAIKQMAHEHGESKLTAKQYNEIQRRIEKVTEDMKKAIELAKKETVVKFDRTGIDAILVDEAHYFKTLPVVTSLNRVPGIPSGRSTRATRLMALIRSVELTTGARRIVLATGTPVANTLPEAYIMARYISPEVLKQAGVEKFDRWLAEFGRITSEPERKATGAIEMKERLRVFRNAARFRQLLEPYWDVELGEDHEDIIKRPKKVQEVIDVEPVRAQLAVVKWLARRARALKSKRMKSEKGEDNYFVISTDGRKSAVDPRLLVKVPAPSLASKRLDAVADNVARIYHKTKEEYGAPRAQVIFSDYGINPVKESGFNVFDELVKLLEERGVPRHEIALFRSNLTGRKRMALVDGVNSGKYHIAIGSTASLGTGTNIQKRLIAAHHVDPLWVPAHMEQRNGRIWRFGNENERVYIYYYVTKRTFDEIMYATLHRKATFITQFLRGTVTDAEYEADAEESFSYEDVAAIAAGDRRVYELLKARNAHTRQSAVIAGMEASVRSMMFQKNNWERAAASRQMQKEILQQVAQLIQGNKTITLLFPGFSTVEVDVNVGGRTEVRKRVVFKAPKHPRISVVNEQLSGLTIEEIIQKLLPDDTHTVSLSNPKDLSALMSNIKKAIGHLEKERGVLFIDKDGRPVGVTANLIPFAASGDVLFAVSYFEQTGEKQLRVFAIPHNGQNLRDVFIRGIKYAADVLLPKYRDYDGIEVISKVIGHGATVSVSTAKQNYGLSYSSDAGDLFVNVFDSIITPDVAEKGISEAISKKLEAIDELSKRAAAEAAMIAKLVENKEKELESASAALRDLESRIAELEQVVGGELEQHPTTPEEEEIIRFIEKNKVSEVKTGTISDIESQLESEDEGEESDIEEDRAFVIANDKASRAFVLSLAGNLTETASAKGTDESLAVSTDEIIGFIENQMGIPVRRTRPGTRPRRGVGRVVGEFLTKARAIRLRVANDLEVAMHEVGHAVEGILFKSDFAKIVAPSDPHERGVIVGELTTIADQVIGVDVYPAKDKPHEGFAEFIRIWLTDGDSAAQSLAPTAYNAMLRHFNSISSKEPFVAKLYALRYALQAWRKQGARARAEAQLSLRGPSFRQRIVAAFMAIKNKDQRQLLRDYFTRLVGDRFVRLRTFMAWVNELLEQQGEEALIGIKNPYHIARAFSRNASGIARAWMTDGIEDPFTGKRLFPGFRQIIENVWRSVQAVEADIRTVFYDVILNNYASYTLERYAKADTPSAAKHTGISPEDAKAIIAELQEKYGDLYAEIDDASRKVTGWNHAVIDWLVSVGAMSKKTGQLIKDSAAYYIPLHRVMREYAEWELKPPTAGGSRAVGRSPVRRMKGSFRPAIDPFEAMYRQTERFIAIGIKTAWAKALFEAGENLPGHGRWFTKKTVKMQKHQIAIKTIAGQLNELLKEWGLAELPDDAADEILTFWAQNVDGTLKEQRTFMVVKDGKPVFYEIIDPELWKVLSDADIEQLPKWIALLLKPFRLSANVVRLGATGLRARFALVTNPIRDTWEAIMGTKGSSGGHLLSIWKPLINAISGRESESEALWRKLGGQMTTLMGLDRKAIKALRDELLAESSGKTSETIKTIVMHPIDTLRGLLGFSESVNRVAEFERVYNDAKKSGYSEEDARIMAMIAAKELTVDFTRAGTIVWFLNSIIPFLNPAIQDLSRVRRLFATKPRTTLIRGFMYITLPVTAMWLLNSDEDWWNELPYWRRILFVHIPLYKKGEAKPSAIIALPLPFTFGMIFGALPLMVLEAQRGRTERMKEYLSAILQSVLPPVGTPLVSVAYQLAKNETWYGKPIVPEALRRVKPEAQYFKVTPEIYKLIGKMFGLSPLKVQYAVEQLTGGLVKDLDFFFKETREPADIPVAGALFERTERLGESYFRLKAERDLLEEIAASIERLILHGEYDAAYNLAIENAEELGIPDSEMIRRALRASIRAKGGRPRQYFRRLKAINKAVGELSDMLRKDTALSEVTEKAREMRKDLDEKFGLWHDMQVEQRR
ncbi:MAG: LPD38 domain-containing protein [Candidatus Methanomethylicaceae archaeon]